MEKNPQDKTCIYGLVDPNTKEIRYVGKADDPQARLKQHLQEKGDSEKHRWLGSLAEQGQIPELRILEEVALGPLYLWEERERWWIAHLREQGARLTNSVVYERYITSFSPRRRAWKGHRPSYGCDLLPGREETEGNAYARDRDTSFDQEYHIAGDCERLPDGYTFRILKYGRPDLLEEYVTWFCQCIITVRHRLPLGVFPVRCLLA